MLKETDLMAGKLANSVRMATESIRSFNDTLAKQLKRADDRQRFVCLDEFSELTEDQVDYLVHERLIDRGR